MNRETLLDFFYERLQSNREFFVYDDGYRVRRYAYREIRQAAFRFAARLDEAGLTAGHKILFWGENRPEWIVAFWGCLLRGVVVVPIDYRASADFLERVGHTVDARVLLVGEDIRPATATWPVWLSLIHI